MPNQEPKPTPKVDVLQRSALPIRPMPAQTATAENSTTLAEIQRKAQLYKITVFALGTLGAAATLMLPWAPWSTLVGSVLNVAALIIGVKTNTLTPEQIDGYLTKLSGVPTTIADALAKKPPR